MGKAKLHEHASLIDALEGPTKVANALNEIAKTKNKPLSPQAVSNWRVRGISVWFRNAFAELLIRNGRRVPKDFTASRHRGW